jgi:hypothetical protein
MNSYIVRLHSLLDLDNHHHPPFLLNCVNIWNLQRKTLLSVASLKKRLLAMLRCCSRLRHRVQPQPGMPTLNVAVHGQKCHHHSALSQQQQHHHTHLPIIIRAFEETGGGGGGTAAAGGSSNDGSGVALVSPSVASTCIRRFSQIHNPIHHHHNNEDEERSPLYADPNY